LEQSLVRFDLYSGPEYLSYGPKIVPIFPLTRYFDFKGAQCTRRQFPLRLAYAITVHKSQGLTLSRVVLDISQKEHSLGLSYVAVLRVKALDGLMFESPFDFSRFCTDDTQMSRDQALDVSVRNLCYQVPALCFEKEDELNNVRSKDEHGITLANRLYKLRVLRLATIKYKKRAFDSAMSLKALAQRAGL